MKLVAGSCWRRKEDGKLFLVDTFENFVLLVSDDYEKPCPSMRQLLDKYEWVADPGIMPF